MVLYEPTVCGYVLTFESSISCEILDYADKHGIPDDLHEISDDSELKMQEDLDNDDEIENPGSELKKDTPFTRELRNDPNDEIIKEELSEYNKDNLDDDDDLHFEEIEDEEENEETRALRKQLLDDVIRIQLLHKINK